MVDDVVECSKDCSLYLNWEDTLNLCEAHRNNKLREPNCYGRVFLGDPCRYGLSEERIQIKKSELEGKADG